MSRTLQVLIALYFLCAGLVGALGMIYAVTWPQFAAALIMSGVSLYALCVIRRYEKTL